MPAREISGNIQTVYLTRTCPRCKIEKTLSEFYSTKWAQNKEHVSVYCKLCTRQRVAERKSLKFEEVQAADSRWRNQPEVKYRKAIADRCRNYGITPEDFEAMWRSQEGLCGICFDPLIFGKNLHVDHNHTTGKVRGLLCPHCNYLLGYAREQKEVLSAAVIYLEEHNG